MPSRKVDPVYTPLLQTSQISQNSQMSDRQTTPLTAVKGVDTDTVQFASNIFYAKEADGVAHIQVIRIGPLVGSCSVQFRTVDGSAVAGKKFKETMGTIEFHPGEHSRRFEIEVINDDAFDTTIEFKVELYDNRGCTLERGFTRCRVMILDDDMFPSNAFEAEIKAGDDAALHNVGFHLLGAFMKFTFSHVPTIAWKSVLMVLLAQLGNAYYLMTIYLKVYLVDVCLNLKDEKTMDLLIIPGHRHETAMLLGAAWILPNVILTGSDYFQMTVLEMGFYIRKYLRVNLFRKYLNYTEEARREVPIQDLKTSIMDDIPDVVQNGYLILFEFARIFGKITCVAFFMLKKHPRSAVPLFVYPTCMFLFMGCRYKQKMRLLAKQGEGESDTQGWLIHADSAHGLITDYRKRGHIVDNFDKVLDDQRALSLKTNDFNFWNELLVPWVTILAIGLYMAIQSKQVIDGHLSLGSFLATINVYKDLGDRFEGVYACFTAMTEAIEPLAGLTGQFNLDTDLGQSMELQRKREDWVSQILRNTPVTGRMPLYDTLPIELKQVCVPHSPSLREPEGVSVQAPQGNIILIRGPHDSGKSTIINILTDNVSLAKGRVLFPTHLRVLHVAYHPMIVKSTGLYRNLIFGQADDEPHDIPRVRRILARLGLTKQTLLEELEKNISNDPGIKKKSQNDASPASPAGIKIYSKGSESDFEPDSEEASEEEEEDETEEDEDGDAEGWYTRLSQSELKRLHLARAFICNPEVMVLHRPVDEFEMNLTDKILGLMREYVDNRGVEMDPSTAHQRRPRTLFFTGGTIKKPRIVDLIWNVDDGGVGIQVERGEAAHVA